MVTLYKPIYTIYTIYTIYPPKLTNHGGQVIGQILHHDVRLSVLVCRYMMGQYVTVHGEVISHVNISRTVVEDGGLFSCFATNRAGTASHSARLNVYGEAVRPIGPRS